MAIAAGTHRGSPAGTHIEPGKEPPGYEPPEKREIEEPPQREPEVEPGKEEPGFKPPEPERYEPPPPERIERPDDEPQRPEQGDEGE